MKTTPQQSPQLIVPATEGIKYAGSKLKLLPHILPLVCGARGVDTVLDGFSGSTRVSQALYQTGRFAVVSNDVSAWSEVFARCYLRADRPVDYYAGLIARLNALPGREGWFTEHYGGDPRTLIGDACLQNGDAPAMGADAEAADGANVLTKHPFQRKNTMRLDAIREEISLWRASGEIDATTESVLLTSLILALDSVDSTLGHFCSYLKRWSKRSYRDLTLRVPRLCFSPERPAAQVTRSDIFDLLRGAGVPSASSRVDLGDPDRLLAYYDPPYGSNNAKMPPSRVRYASYYHLWTSVVLNDRPTLFGKAARREDSRDGCAASVFEDFRALPDGRHVAMDAIDRLIAATPARYVLLSYSSSGRASRDELLDIIHSRARLRQTLTLDHANHVMARMQWTRQWLNADAEHKEYLFLLEK